MGTGTPGKGRKGKEGIEAKRKTEKVEGR